MRRGRDISVAYTERIQAERLAQPNVGRCAWCPDLMVEGTLAETRAVLLQHRLEHHPEAKPSKHKHRIRPMSTMVTKKSIGENIAAVREQGGATWEGAA